MKSFLILCLLAICSYPFSPIFSQCACPPIPDSGGTTVVVSNVSELQNALSAANSNGGNYTILLEDSTYTLTNNLLYINAGMNNLTIRSVSGNRDAVAIMGQGAQGNVGWIFSVAASNFTLADMTIGGVFYHAVHIHGEHNADNCLIQNVRFIDIREQMLKVSSDFGVNFSDGGIVQCCEFEFTSGIAYQWYTGGIDAHQAKDWQVRYNTFKNIRSPDSGLAEHAIHFWSSSENTLVENNLIINCDRGIGFGLTSDPDKGHFGGIIRNNIIHTTRDVGIGLENARDAKVYNNTLQTINYFNSIEYRFPDTYNAHIVNNLVNEAIASRSGGTGTVENNYEYSSTTIFSDAANFDYHLSSAVSQVVDAGMMLDEIVLDYDCHVRSSGGLPDIGADEYNSTFACIPPDPLLINISNCNAPPIVVSWEPVANAILYQFHGHRAVTGTPSVNRTVVNPGFSLGATAPSGYNVEVRLRAQCVNGNWSAWSPLAPQTIQCTGN